MAYMSRGVPFSYKTAAAVKYRFSRTSILARTSQYYYYYYCYILEYSERHNNIIVYDTHAT